MARPRFFTGITATGTLTLGHYLGVISSILALQEEYEVFIMIGDLHALSVTQTSNCHRERAINLAALLYACGIREDCKVFLQSEIKEHCELAWLLAPWATVSELTNMIQYKEKKKNQETGSLALLAYPVLMAADIFLYDPDLVVVGQDQQQHCELATNLAKKFNNFYQSASLKLPRFSVPALSGKIMGLQNPQKKMSKSQKDHLALLDNPEVIQKKIQQAQTDSENQIYYEPTKKPGISNLLLIYALLAKISLSQAEKKVNQLNYQQFKEKLAELISSRLSSIQEKFFSFYQTRASSLLQKHQVYCQKVAQAKIRELKKCAGLAV